MIPNGEYPLDFLPCRGRDRNVPRITADKVGRKTIANMEKSRMHFCHGTSGEGSQLTVLRPKGQLRVRLGEELAYSKGIIKIKGIRRARGANPEKRHKPRW